MNMAPLHETLGLTKAAYKQFRATGYINTEDLSAQTVLQRVDDVELPFNDVMFIKNLMQDKSAYKEIVYTASNGFMAVKKTPNEIIRKVERHSQLKRHIHMQVLKKMVGAHGHPPYVLGDIRLIPIEKQVGSNYSWVASNHVSLAAVGAKMDRMRLELAHQVQINVPMTQNLWNRRVTDSVAMADILTTVRAVLAVSGDPSPAHSHLTEQMIDVAYRYNRGVHTYHILGTHKVTGHPLRDEKANDIYEKIVKDDAKSLDGFAF